MHRIRSASRYALALVTALTMGSTAYAQTELVPFGSGVDSISLPAGCTLEIPVQIRVVAAGSSAGPSAPLLNAVAVSGPPTGRCASARARILASRRMRGPLSRVTQ